MFPKHSLENKVLCQVGNGPPGLFSLEPVHPPTDARNKPTFSDGLLLICLLIEVCFARGSSALLIHGLLVAPCGAHWDWQDHILVLSHFLRGVLKLAQRRDLLSEKNPCCADLDI